MTSDPIADMLTRIRNAVAASRNQVVMPHSKIKEAIANLLKDNGFVAEVKVENSGSFKSLLITIYGDGEEPVISSLQRVSKPVRRVYASSQDIPLVLGGRGMVILSTPGGLMTGREARQKGLGGELICKVW
jgi:small subunit ribosomal protein S8